MSDEVIKHPNVIAALAALQAECPNVFKTKKHAQGYKYATLEDWIDTVQPLLARHGLAVVVSFPEVHEAGEYDTKGGTWTKVRVKAIAEVVLASQDAVDESNVQRFGGVRFEGWGEGADPADKAIYKAMTGARKYLYAAISGAMTTDDPENDERDSAQRGARPAQTREPARERATQGLGGPQGATETGGGVELISAAQVADLWKLFRGRVAKVAPDMTKDDIEGAYRLILKVTGGVSSTKDIPRAKFALVGKAINNWTPPNLPKEEGFGESDNEETS